MIFFFANLQVIIAEFSKRNYKKAANEYQKQLFRV